MIFFSINRKDFIMKQQREHWGSRLGFILAAAGSAIGLGSLWRFPYMTGENGGGVFVLLYLLFTFIISLPIFLGELLIGRHTQKSPVFAYSEMSNHSHHWKLVGWLNVITSFLILSAYCVIGGWCVNYSLMSINHFTAGRSVEEIRSIFTTMAQAGDVNTFWLFIFILLNVGVVFGGIRKGIEYWSKILTPLLLVLLVGLLIYSTTLDGFGQAVSFVLKPNFANVKASTFLNALGMSFFTISVGLGIIVTYGSYMKQSEDIPKTGAIVACMTVLISIMAALMIFPVIFTFGFAPEGGPGLIFQTLPVLFEKLPGTLVLSSLFFFLVTFTALTSSISLFEVLVANLMELLTWPRARAVLIVAAATFVFGIPSALSGSGDMFSTWSVMYGKDFFTTILDIVSNWLMPISALLTTVFVGWFVHKKIIKEEFLRGSKLRYIFGIWFFLVKWLAPIGIILMILQEGDIIDINKMIQMIAG